MLPQALQQSIEMIPAGKYAVGVSGGADSVALLLALHETPALSLHVVHLNHQTRGSASDGDAQFVANLARRLGLPCTIALLSEVERHIPTIAPNPSARYRAARLQLFSQVAQQHQLAGVILAHHGDDQAETVLHRLIRGGGIAGLAAMAFSRRVNGLLILRPLLSARRQDLRQFLAARGQDFREDASNQSDAYFRNRLRKILAGNEELTQALLCLSKAAARYRQWTRRVAPRLQNPFPARILWRLPTPIARQSARRWLIDAGAPPGQLSAAVLDRLLEMARDAASPSRQDFPGPIHVRRKSAAILAVKKPSQS